MQLVVLEIQVKGNLWNLGCFGANNIKFVTSFLPMELVCRFSDSELVTRQKQSSRVFLALLEYDIVFITGRACCGITSI